MALKAAAEEGRGATITKPQEKTTNKKVIRRSFPWQSLPTGLAFDNTCHCVRDCIALEWKMAGQHFEHNAAE